MKHSSSSFFWPSYTDLMTSLFFVMLVLYVLTIAVLKSKENGYLNDALKYRKFQAIEQALKQLDGQYFRYDDRTKRFRMNVDVNFPANNADLGELPPAVQQQLLQAGRTLYNRVRDVTRQNPDVQYMVVVEGNAQRYGDNWLRNPDAGYQLSFRRALALVNFWKNNGLDFDRFRNCEVLTVGSGHFGKARDTQNEINNRRFTIQITSKVGQL